MKLPRHIAFTLEHNECATVYKTVAQKIADDAVFNDPDSGYYCDESWVSPEEREKAIATNSIWTARWYPDTPGGFCLLHASDLNVLLAELEKEADE